MCIRDSCSSNNGCDENRERQQIEAEVLAQAMDQVERDADLGLETALVVAGEGWHPGVLGIVCLLYTSLDMPLVAPPLTARPLWELDMDDAIARGEMTNDPTE